MNLKSYMRGVGIGIIVTAVILLVTGGNGKKMTDDEIKARAKELGMTENPTYVGDIAMAEDTVVEDDGDYIVPIIETIPEKDGSGDSVVTKEVEPTKEPTKEVTKEPTKEVTPEPTKEPTKEVTPEPTKEPTKEITPEPTKEPTKEVTPEPTKEPTKEVTPTPTKEAVQDNQTDVDDSKMLIIIVNSGDGSGTVARRLYEAGLVANANEYDKYLMENGYDKNIKVGKHKISVTATKEEIAKNLVTPVK